MPAFYAVVQEGSFPRHRVEVGDILLSEVPFDITPQVEQDPCPSVILCKVAPNLRHVGPRARSP